MNTLKNLAIVALISIPMISFAASSNLWERNMEKKLAKLAPPELVEGPASKMNHTAVEHKRYLLGENYPGQKNKLAFTKNSPVVVHTDHMAVDHKRHILSEARRN
tara:strand:+ start:1533 stop:1847 length:315 start_codon:yes stop_codon:yes gene_type:complete